MKDMRKDYLIIVDGIFGSVIAISNLGEIVSEIYQDAGCRSFGYCG